MRRVLELPVEFRRHTSESNHNFADCVSRKGTKAKRKDRKFPQMTQMFADKFNSLRIHLR